MTVVLTSSQVRPPGLSASSLRIVPMRRAWPVSCNGKMARRSASSRATWSSPLIMGPEAATSAT